MVIDIVRAWKDAEYFDSLTPEQQASVPPNPVGEASTSEELQQVAGGAVSTVTLGGPKRCGTCYPECCYNSTIGPRVLYR